MYGNVVYSFAVDWTYSVKSCVKLVRLHFTKQSSAPHLLFNSQQVREVFTERMGTAKFQFHIFPWDEIILIMSVT